MQRSTLSLKSFVLALSIAAIPDTSADVVFSGDFTAGEGVLQFTDDLVFNINTTGNYGIFSFVNIVSNDGSFDHGADLNFSFLLNGLALTTNPVSFFDNSSNAIGDIAGSDSYMPFNNFSRFFVEAGDVLTVEAGTWTNIGGANFNSDYNSVGTFAGDIRLTDLSGNTLATQSFIPEPTSLSLCAFGFIALFKRHR